MVFILKGGIMFDQREHTKHMKTTPETRQTVIERNVVLL